MNHKDTNSAVIEPECAPTGLEKALLDGLPQVRFIARRIHRRLPPHVPLDDLVQAGTLGLIDAVKKFNPTKHVRLQSYAKFRIRGAILDGLREMDWGPRHLRGQGRRVEAARQALLLRLKRPPTEEDLATEMNMSIEKLQCLEGALHALGLCALDPKTLGTQAAGQYLSATPEGDPFSMCLRNEMRFHIKRAQDCLNENERLVIRLYYAKELTMKEVGRALGIGESRVSQIHSEALFHLRAKLGQILRACKENATGTYAVKFTSALSARAKRRRGRAATFSTRLAGERAEPVADEQRQEIDASVHSQIDW